MFSTGWRWFVPGVVQKRTKSSRVLRVLEDRSSTNPPRARIPYRDDFEHRVHRGAWTPPKPAVEEPLRVSDRIEQRGACGNVAPSRWPLAPSYERFYLNEEAIRDKLRQRTGMVPEVLITVTNTIFFLDSTMLL